MLRNLLLAATAVAAFSAPASATSLTASVTGSVDTNQLFPVPGQQTIQLTGAFTSYVGSSDLPQINAGDYSAYTFTVSGISSGYDAPSNTVTYSLTSGSINAYGFLIQSLAPSFLTVAFSPDGTIGTINGTLQSAGPTARPPGFPGVGPIDFSPANGAVITGTYTRLQGRTSDADGTFVSTITFGAVPEPATWAMMIGGFGMVGCAMRSRRRQSVRFA